MARRADYVAQNIYGQHIHGKDSRRYLNSPVDNRTELLERFYRRKLTEMCIGRFKWSGLPVSVDALFMETTLFNSGLSFFYFDPRFGQYLAPQAAIAGKPNYANNPTAFRLWGTGGFPTTRVSAVHGVPIWGSITRTPDVDAVLIYAKRFAELDRTIELNSKNARRTKVLVANEDEQLAVANVNTALDVGDPAIFVRKQGDAIGIHENIEAIDLGINMQDIERLHILKVRLWTECMEYLGINGGSKDKRERVQAAEVDANAEQVGLSRVTALKTRQLAARQINRKYPALNVSVGYETEDDYEELPTALDIGGV